MFCRNNRKNLTQSAPRTQSESPAEEDKFNMNKNGILEKIIKAEMGFNLFVEDKVIMDLKAKDSIVAINRSKLLTYLRLNDNRPGLIINFHV
jgi:GxxExxY protein